MSDASTSSSPSSSSAASTSVASSSSSSNTSFASWPITTSPVCVTGASGYVASHIVKQLLEKGYSVRGTVRSIKDARTKYKYLYDLDNSDNLELVAADLLDEGSYDEAVKGCEYVMHTASPYVLTVSDPQKELVQKEPAVNGTLNVLKACLAAGVKKVVLTSSVAAITDSPNNDHVYTENDWNEESSLTRNPYYYSKTVAEKAAWDYAKEHPEMKLVVVNPFIVIGPNLAGGLNQSTEIYKQLLNGEVPGLLDLGWGVVDVRDVATAHILVMESDKAEGRYICWNATLPMKDAVALMKQSYPEYPLPKTDLSCGPGTALVKLASHFQEKGTGQYLRTNLGRFPRLDNTKLKSLGMQFIPIEQSIRDTCADLIASGQVKEPKKKNKKESKKSK